MNTENPYAAPAAALGANLPDSVPVKSWGYRFFTSAGIALALTGSSLFGGVYLVLWASLVGFPMAFVITTIVTWMTVGGERKKLNGGRVGLLGAVSGFLSGACSAAILFGWAGPRVILLFVAGIVGALGGGLTDISWLEFQERKRIRKTVGNLRNRYRQ